MIRVNGFIRDGLLEGMRAMWERVDIEGIESLMMSSSEDAEHGLDVSAESMHQLFLADLPHLDSVRRNHGNVVETASVNIESSIAVARSLRLRIFRLTNLTTYQLEPDSISLLRPIPSLI